MANHIKATGIPNKLLVNKKEDKREAVSPLIG